jgi:hypothetical protein
LLAARHLHLGQPKLILVGGPAATGRPAVARGLRDRGIGRLLEAPSDPAGVAESPDADEDAQACDHVLEVAEEWLRSGESVIVDAAWNRAADRLAARRTAERLGAGMVEMLCHARPDTLALRGGADDIEAASETGGETEAVEPAGGEVEVWPQAAVLETDSTDQRVLDTAVDLILENRGC